MEQDLDVSGRWWFPGQEADAVPGRLTFTPDGGGELDLIEDLDSLQSSEQPGRRTWESGVYPLIHGRVDQREYTLVDSFQIGRYGWPHARGRERIRVPQIFEGAWFGVDEGVAGTQIVAEVRHLTYWMARTGLDDDFADLDDATGRFATVDAHWVEPVEVDLPDGGRLHLEQVLGVQGDGVTGREMTQSFRARIVYDHLVEVQELVRPLGDFRALVSIAARSAAVLEQVDLRHPDVEDRGDPLPIRLHTGWTDWSPNARTIPKATMAFSWDQLDGVDGLHRWMGVAATHRRALNRVMSARHRSGLFVDDRLLTYCAALEAFDRTRTQTSGSKFKTRLRRCVDFVDDPRFIDFLGDIDVWAERLRIERNDVAHNLGQGSEEGARIIFLGESVYWLFVVCMLRAAGLDEAVGSVLGDRALIWVRPRLHDVLGLPDAPI